jgi:SAM-dependent methyltransferase
MRFGYRLARLTPEERSSLKGIPGGNSGLPGPADTLRADNPRLRELRHRYASLRSPMADRSLWSPRFLRRELDLSRFRDDNPYVWQYRFTPENLRRKHYLFAHYIAQRDPRGLLGTLIEDGAFGCHTFEFEAMPKVSRDLLDSINEIYFLDRVGNILGETGLQVLDIGAGYGRLAHRMAAAASGLERYYCVDAIPESTFLSEFYLQYRQCEPKTRVVPLDELEPGLRDAKISLAVNIHSFSEMPYDAIAGWLRLLADLAVPRLLIVPNDGTRLLSYDPGHRRRDFLPLLRSMGYRLVLEEPTFATADFRNWVGNEDRFFYFERATS